MTVTLESLKKSVNKKKGKSMVFAWLADLERAAGDLDNALKLVDGGLTLYPHDVAAMLVRAKILFEKEEFDACITQCENVLVKDSFNLAAQKIMGDAYDKLDKVAERNLCYRRYHDMDPLNSFWKEEYDVVLDVAPAAAAGAALSEDAFSMGDDSMLGSEPSLNLSESDLNFNTDEAPAGELSMPDGAGLFEKSSEASLDEASLGDAGEDPASEGNTFEQAFGEAFGGISDDVDEDELATASPLSSLDSDIEAPVETVSEEIATEPAESGLFEKSADSFDLGIEDSLPADAEASLDEPSLGEPSSEESAASPFSSFGDIAEPAESVEEPAEDDPFAALAAMLPNSDAADDETVEELSASLDSVMSTFTETRIEELPEESLPADDNISGTDVNSALSDMFGLDDDLEAEESNAAAEPADVLDQQAEANASQIFGESAFSKSAEEPTAVSLDEDKPVSVDNAFDSIFGEDELPEEKPVESKSQPAVEDKPVSVDDAFDSIFGEDELPEELPQDSAAEPAAELAVESLELPAEEPEPVAEKTVDADKPVSVDDAFDSIFGEDELPEELPQAAAAEPAAEVAEDATEGFSLFEKSAETQDLSLDVSLDLPAESSLELPAEESLNLPAEEAADLDLPAEESLDLPAEEPASFVTEVESPEAPALSSAMDFVLDDEPVAAEAPKPAAEDVSLSVDSAFDSLFGDDDDLEETPAEAAPAVDANSFAEDNSLAEQVDLAETGLELPSAKEAADAAAEEKPVENDLVKEMGGAFASMFGDDDSLDLPSLNAGNSDAALNAAPMSEQESTGAAFEEAAAQVASASADETVQSDLNKTFDSLFGNDDDLDLPSEEVAAPKAPATPDLNSLENEVSGAFKGLFDMEDDSLEESKPSNSGVDFLMSGDSDDEIATGLINNPDAPLDRGAQELDESMNTRTLAEIYFDQGLYGKALDIYTDLAGKNPEDVEIANRLDEIEKIYRSKFGGNT